MKSAEKEAKKKFKSSSAVVPEATEEATIPETTEEATEEATEQQPDDKDIIEQIKKYKRNPKIKNAKAILYSMNFEQDKDNVDFLREAFRILDINIET